MLNPGYYTIDLQKNDFFSLTTSCSLKFICCASVPLLELLSKKKVLDDFWKHLLVQSGTTSLTCISAAFLCQVRNHQSRAISWGPSQTWFSTAHKDTQEDRFLPGSSTLKRETRALLLPEKFTLLALPRSAFKEDWSQSIITSPQISPRLQLSQGKVTGIKNHVTSTFPQYKPGNSLPLNLI